MIQQNGQRLHDNLQRLLRMTNEKKNDGLNWNPFDIKSLPDSCRRCHTWTDNNWTWWLPFYISVSSKGSFSIFAAERRR